MKDNLDLHLQPGEKILWHTIDHIGFWNRRLLSYTGITQTEAIINHREESEPHQYYRMPLTVIYQGVSIHAIGDVVLVTSFVGNYDACGNGTIDLSKRHLYTTTTN